MRILFLCCLILSGCASPSYVPVYSGGGYSDSALLIHGDLSRPSDFFFGDGTGGGMLIHGDLTQPNDFISGF